MKITKKTLRLGEKVINAVVILVMLLQPIGAPGLLLAVAEAPATEPIPEQIREAVVADMESPAEEPAPEAEEKTKKDPAATEEIKTIPVAPDPDPETEKVANEETGTETPADAPEAPVPTEEIPDGINEEVLVIETPAADSEGQNAEAQLDISSSNLEILTLEIKTYADAGYSNSKNEFNQGEVVYIKGQGLQEGKYYRVVIDPPSGGGSIAYVGDCAEGSANVEREYNLAQDAKVSTAWYTYLREYSNANDCNNNRNKDKEAEHKFAVVENSTYIPTRICHATKSGKSPFVSITPATSGILMGHAGSSHQDGEDVIPPIAGFLPEGQNWDVQGQTLWENDCVAEYCGDGIKNGEEQCDDGNSENGDACNNQCQLKKMHKETVRTCSGEGELYLYVDDPFQNIATSFTTERDQLLIFTGNSRIDGSKLNVKVNGSAVAKSSAFSNSYIEIFSVDTDPGDVIAIDGVLPNGARNVQGYLAQDQAAPVYDLSTARFIFNDNTEDLMYLTPGEYSYVFFDKFTYNSKSDQTNNNKDTRALRVRIYGNSSLVDKTYTAPFPVPAEGAVADGYTVTQSGNYTIKVDTKDSIFWALPKCEKPKPTIAVDKVANPTTLDEPGGDVTFTFTVTNTGIEPVTITSLIDDKFGVLVGDDDCKAGTVLDPSDSCMFDSVKALTGNAGDVHTNVFTAHAKDEFGVDATDDDSATVEFIGVPPAILVTKTANPTIVPESGGDVEFTFTVQNTSTFEAVTITSLSDSVYGILDGNADCKVGTKLAVGETCEFSVTKKVAGDASGPAHNNIFTAHAEDDDGTDAKADDNATVEFTDVEPVIEVLKTGNPTAVPETGGDVTFTYRVTNSSAEPVEITVLTDDKFGTLAGDADCRLGTILAVGASCEFAATFAIPAGDVSKTHVDVFTATVKDNENKEATDTDDETITYTDVKPTVTLEKTVDDNSKPEPGGTFNYTLTITNTSLENVSIIRLTDDNALSLECLGLIGDVLIPSQQVSCSYSVDRTEAGIYPNTAEVAVEDNEKNQASDADDESVEVTDVLPTVTLDKTVDSNSKPEPGGTFNYTLTITNTSVEDVTITSLTDDNALSQECLDLIGDILTPSQQVSCNYSVDRTEAGTYPNTAAVTVEDNEKNSASDADDESVEVTDVLPIIEVLKTAGTPSLDVPSASVTFTFTVKNNSVEAVTITSLTDDVFGTLTGDADCQVGTVLAPGVSCSFDSTEIVSGAAGALHTNIFTAHAEDNEKNDATASDNETVTFNAGRIIVDKITDPSADPQSFRFTLSGGPDPAVSQTFSLTDLSAPHDSGLIFPGTYSVIEDVVAGWQTSANCQVEEQTIFEEVLAVFASSSPDKIVLGPGQTIRCTFTNTFIPPMLTIEKFNDQWPNIQDPGDTVDYTIVVRASNNNVYGAFVKDLLPQGFTFAGITSVKKNGGDLAVADPAYASPGTWKLGDLASGDEVVIKFKAQIGSSQDPGTYKDLAWAQGTDDRQAQVLAVSVPAPKPDQGVVTDNFVGTQIELAPAVQPETVILAESTETKTKTKHKTKNVLGAAILPATGADPTWPLVALIILIVGLNLIMESKKRSKKYQATLDKTLVKSLIFIIFSSALIFSGNIAKAAADPNISVRITKPKAAMATNEFRIGFVALDIKGRELTGKCFKTPEEEVPVDFVAKAGGNSGDCLIDLPDGTYQFYAVASDPGNPANYGQSETVTVEIKTGAPSVPLNYSRDENSCMVNFTTANDGLTAGVELYRSTEISFAADDSTYVGTAAVGPNANGSVTDPNGNCGDYYYAIRAVSAAGAGSAFVGDEKVTVKRRTRTRTRTVTVNPETATGAIPVAATEGGAAAGTGTVEGVATEEGEEASAGEGSVLGEETEEAGGEDETSTAFAETMQKNRWLLALGVLAILAAIYVYQKKRNRGIEK